MPSIEINVNINAECNECGSNITSNVRIDENSDITNLIINPCSTCINLSYKDGYGDAKTDMENNDKS